MQLYSFGLQNQTKKKEIHDRKPEPTYTNHLYKQCLISPDNDTCNSVFGAYFLMETCDVRWLSTVTHLASRILPVSMETFSLPASSDRSITIPIQSLLSVIGNSMFLGPFYNSVESFDFRIDFLMAITGEVAAIAATSIFYEVINYHLKLLSESLGAIILDITVPNVSMDSKAANQKSISTTKPISIWTHRDWNNAEMKAREMVTNLADIYINNKKEHMNSIPFITVQALVSGKGETNCDLDQTTDGYIKIRIQYVPHTLQIEGNGTTGEIWSCFGNRDNDFLNHLFESIFTKESHAEAFMTLVLNQSLSFTNTGNERDAGIRSLHQKKQLFNSANNNDADRFRTDVKSLFGIFKFPDANSGSITEEGPPNKTLNNSESDLFESKRVATENLWAQNIVKSNILMDFFPMLQNVIKLIVSNSSLLPNNIDRNILGTEVRTILQSTLYKLYQVIQMNVTVRELMYCFNEHGNGKLLLSLFQAFVREITKTLNTICKNQKISYVNGLLKRIMGRQRFVATGDFQTDIKELINPKMMLELRYWNSLLHSLLWQMIGDCLLKCPNFQQLLTSFQNQFPQLVNKTEVLVNDTEFSKENDFKNFYQSTSQTTGNVTQDIITYLKSIDFNVYWKGFLVSMLEEIGNNDDNAKPFSILSEQFNVASINFDLAMMRRNTTENVDQLNQIECVDPNNVLYKASNYEAYGLKSALMLFDGKEFSKLSSIFSSVEHKVYEKSVGLFEVSVATGLIGQLPYYGKVDPLVRMMDLVDHIYVSGPDNCLEEGSQVFAQTVIKHMLSYKSILVENSLVIGLFLPEIKQVWSIDDLTKDSREVMIQLAKSVRQFGTVYARIVIPFQWRYLSIVKHFRFHFVNFQRNQYFNSSANDNRSLEEFRLLFFNKSSAQCYFTRGGYLKVAENPYYLNNIYTANQRIDEIITDRYENQYWIDLYRALVTKSMINDDFTFVEESKHIFFGTLGFLDYCKSLIKTMQFVIFQMLSTKMFSLETSVEPVKAEIKPNSRGRKKETLAPVTKKIMSSDIIDKMFRGVYLMLMKIFENKNLAHLHLKEVLTVLLNEIAEKNGKNEIHVTYNDQTILKLEQIRQILEFVECFYGYNCKESCPRSFAYIQSIVVKPVNVSVSMNESAIQYEQMVALKMIKSDAYKQWSIDPSYGCDF